MSKFDEYLKIAKEKIKAAADRRTNASNRKKTPIKTAETQKGKRRNTKKNQSGVPKKGFATKKKPMSRKDAILRTIKRDFSVVSFKKYTHIFAFPLVFVYFELMLRICSGTSLFVRPWACFHCGVFRRRKMEL